MKSFTIKIGGDEEKEHKPMSPFERSINGMLGAEGPSDPMVPMGPDPAIQSVAEDLVAAFQGGGAHSVAAALQRFADILEARFGE